MADILREQAFEEVSEDINTSVGLQIVSEPGFLNLCSPDGQVVTKVPHSTDPIEVLQAFGDPQPSCQECGASMKKQIAMTSFSLKGAGWAKDNYGLKTSSE